MIYAAERVSEKEALPTAGLESLFERKPPLYRVREATALAQEFLGT